MIGAKDEGSERYIRGLTVGVALCDVVGFSPTRVSSKMLLCAYVSARSHRPYATTNPDSPYHWLKIHYLDNADLKSNRILWSDHFTMDDNPNLTAEFVESQKRLVPQRLCQQGSSKDCLGLWLEGSIYKVTPRPALSL